MKKMFLLVALTICIAVFWLLLRSSPGQFFAMQGTPAPLKINVTSSPPVVKSSVIEHPRMSAVAAHETPESKTNDEMTAGVQVALQPIITDMQKQLADKGMVAMINFMPPDVRDAAFAEYANDGFDLNNLPNFQDPTSTRLLNDLPIIQNAVPMLNSTGDTATYRIDGGPGSAVFPQSASRSIKFKKINGQWYYVDGS